MRKAILGEYDFRNATAINFIDNGEEEINKTILHEIIHMLLTKQTIWGIACYLIRKVVIYDNNYKYMLDEFCTHSRKVQEAAAVFNECIYIVKNKGYNEYFKYLQYLKNNNKEYYRYANQELNFKKILKIIYMFNKEIDCYITKILLNTNINAVNLPQT